MDKQFQILPVCFRIHLVQAEQPGIHRDMDICVEPKRQMYRDPDDPREIPFFRIVSARRCLTLALQRAGAFEGQEGSRRRRMTASV